MHIIILLKKGEFARSRSGNISIARAHNGFNKTQLETNYKHKSTFMTYQYSLVLEFVLADKSIEKEVRSRRVILKPLKTEICVFVALKLGLTFLLNFVMWVNYEVIPERLELFGLALQFQMLLPAFSAIILTFLSSSRSLSPESLGFCSIIF